MNAQHTPTPWQWDEPANWHGIQARVCTEKYEPIAQVQLSGWPRKVGLANTEFIVRAVNCHADLLAACEDLLLNFNMLACTAAGGAIIGNFKQIVQGAEAVIVRAKGEAP